MGLNDDGVLVTGAYGLLGSWLVKALLDRDMRVVVIKRDAPSWSPLELMDLERRVGRLTDGPLRCAIGHRTRSRRRFDPIASFQEILPELGRIHLVHAAVMIAMDTDLVTAQRRFTHQIRMAVGDPAQKKDRRAMPASVTQESVGPGSPSPLIAT